MNYDYLTKWTYCTQCEKRRARPGDQICDCCSYQNHAAWMGTLDYDDQDWGFAHCEECGSSLDDCGVCRNQSCGASPDVGKDWI